MSSGAMLAGDVRLSKLTIYDHFAGLWRQYQAGHYTDVEIWVDNSLFRCHRIVLAAMSDYFDAMFSSGMCESRSGRVTLHEIEPVTFESVLRFLYTAGDVVTHDNVQDMLSAADMLQIPRLKDRCERFVVENVSPETAIGAWRLGKVQNSCELELRAFEIILKNFQELRTSDDFVSLCKDDVIEILGNSKLCVPSEDIVCDAALAWIAFDSERSIDCKQDLFDICATRWLVP
jgi:hypothetical protein